MWKLQTEALEIHFVIRWFNPSYIIYPCFHWETSWVLRCGWRYDALTQNGSEGKSFPTFCAYWIGAAESWFSLLRHHSAYGMGKACDYQHHSIDNMNAIVVSSWCACLAHCVSVTKTGKTLCGGHCQLRRELSSLSPNGFERNLSHRCKRYQLIFMGIQDIQCIHDMLTSRSWQKTHLVQLLTCLGVRPMTWSSSHDSLGDPGTPQLVFQKFICIKGPYDIWFWYNISEDEAFCIIFALFFPPNFPNHFFYNP